MPRVASCSTGCFSLPLSVRTSLRQKKTNRIFHTILTRMSITVIEQAENLRRIDGGKDLNYIEMPSDNNLDGDL